SPFAIAKSLKSTTIVLRQNLVNELAGQRVGVANIWERDGRLSAILVFLDEDRQLILARKDHFLIAGSCYQITEISRPEPAAPHTLSLVKLPPPPAADRPFSELSPLMQRILSLSSPFDHFAYPPDSHLVRVPQALPMTLNDTPIGLCEIRQMEDGIHATLNIARSSRRVREGDEFEIGDRHYRLVAFKTTPPTYQFYEAYLLEISK
ncbi:MAG: hypothetical protein ACQKBY_05275, partial [Verrucomicrobiales bacterium]